MGKYGMLIDTTRCIGCRSCQVACKQWNDLPGEVTRNRGSYRNPTWLSAKTWTLVDYLEVERGQDTVFAFIKRQCMHCEHPACASACPVGALQKTESGPVVYDDSKCIGCRYCMTACPFGVPTFDWDKGLLDQPLIRKCRFCYDRVSNGLPPACSKTCPTKAILFGERDNLISEAESRIHQEPARYVNSVYGKDEVGGTSVLYLAHVPFEELGLPRLGHEAIPELSEKVMSGTIPFAVGWGAVLAGAYVAMRLQERHKPHTPHWIYSTPEEGGE